jgi:hypothetical protein
VNKNVSPAPNSALVHGSKSAEQFLIILIFSFFIITGIGYYAYKNGQIKLSPKGNMSFVDDAPISSEKYYGTFVNPYHNYSIELPEGCSIFIHNVAVGIASTSYLSCTGYGNNEGYFRIGTENLYKNLSFEQNAEEWMNYYSDSSTDQVTNTQVYTEGDKSGIKYSVSYSLNKKEGKAVWIYLPFSDEKILYIKYGSTNAELFDKYNQILSTFKFLD